MQAPIDTTRTIEIGYSPTKMILLSLVGAAFLGGGGYWMAQATHGTAEHSAEATRFVGYLMLALFGLLLVASVVRLLSYSGAPLTISPAGIRDTRVSPDFIPWTAVTSGKTWSYDGHKLLLLTLDPEIESMLRFTLVMRASRWINRRFGVGGVTFGASGLAIGYDELWHTAKCYAAAHGRGF